MATLRTNEQLRAESRTLWYEFHQFSGVTDILRNGAFRENTTVHNSLVESFVIHCRALCAFFYGDCKGFPPARDGDLIARHFIPTWEAIRPSPSPVLADAKERCDKQVAHMTEHRRDLNFVLGKDSVWSVPLIENELRHVLSGFLHHARRDLFASEAWLALKSLCPIVPAYQQSSSQSLTAKTCPPDEAVTDVRTIAPGANFHGKTE